MIPLLHAETRWECPNCPATHLTTEAQPHIPYHNCPGLRGILAPYVMCMLSTARITWGQSRACKLTLTAGRS
jgi:hypothetical protein